MSEEIVPQGQPLVRISIPTEVAVQIKLMEFDKQIAEVETQVASLKQQKMTFIYEANVEAVKNKYQGQPTV